MNTSFRIGLASVLALSTAAPVSAQQYRETQQSQGDQARYQDQQAQYQDQQAQYQARKDAYDVRKDDYDAARADYQRRHDVWEQDRARYDARYGYGAYARRYAAPTWDEAYWAGRRDASSYGVNSAYTDQGCRSDNSSTVTGGVIGALAGAALGSNVAANGRGTEGAVLGAVVGGAIGAGVGRAHNRYKCDSRGPYFSYSQTIPYRENAWDRDRASGAYNYSYYTRQHCRLASAPIDADGRDYRYVRVCPDGDGRYRITG